MFIVENWESKEKHEKIRILITLPRDNTRTRTITSIPFSIHINTIAYICFNIINYFTVKIMNILPCHLIF